MKKHIRQLHPVFTISFVVALTFGVVKSVSAVTFTAFSGLGDLAGGGGSSSANGVSADGSVIVGSSTFGGESEAFRWTSGGGMVGLGDLPGGLSRSTAQGVSADGSVIVGGSDSASSGNQSEAFRWTSGGGMVGLGDLTGGSFRSFATGISADGSVIVGGSDSASGFEAFRWTSGGGMVGLGGLTGGSFSNARGVSADGSVIVGGGDSASGNEAFIWDETSNMMQSIRDGLIADGFDLTGWTELRDALAVSADGMTVVGFGTHNGTNEAFFARIAPVPVPAAIWLMGSALLGLAGFRRKRTS